MNPTDPMECLEITNAAGDTLTVKWQDSMSILEGVLDGCEADAETLEFPSYSVRVVKRTQEQLDELDTDTNFHRPHDPRPGLDRSGGEGYAGTVEALV